MLKLSFGLFLLIQLFPFHTLGKNSLDDHIFLSCETTGNIKEKLSDGYRGFIISQNAQVTTILNDANTFLNENSKTLLVFIFKQQIPGLNKQLKKHPLKQFIAIPETDHFDNLIACEKKGKQLFIFTPKKTIFSYSLENYICEYTIPKGFPSKIENGFSGPQENNFVVFKPDNTIHILPDSLKQHTERIPELFNLYTGKLPNFFITKDTSLFFSFKRMLSKHRWYTANVTYNKNPVKGITWKEMPGMESYGKIHTKEVCISPKKNGLHFSPDVVSFTELTSESTKEFHASQKDLKSELVLSLKFEKNVTNSCSENTKTPYSNIEYAKDKSRGWCGVFNGKDNYIDYDTDIELNKDFTISAWVKPSTVKQNRSILGKGEALSIKFCDGKLLFTSPGIKDHYTDSIIVVANEWQQLCYVISAGNTVRFFRNGLFVAENDAAEIISTKQSLLIGTNLWDEFFEGMMDDLAIWNRALNDNEVKHVYSQGIESKNDVNNKSWLFILLFIIPLGVILIWFRKQRHTKIVSPKTSTFNTISTEHTSIGTELNVPLIEFFGGFKFINRDGEDLTSKFSKRRKQIFILVLISSFNEKGITSKQLTDNLWAGRSIESAKNNRSTQIKRLREILAQNSGVNIEFNSKKWIIQFEQDVYCDLAQYFLLLDQLKKEEKGTYNADLLSQVLSIIEKGAILPNMEEEWLDEFKSTTSDELLELLLPLYLNSEFMSDPRLVLRFSDALFILDPLNETVLKHKVKKLIELDKKTRAHECLEHFEKYYQQCYNQPFSKTISDLIDSE